MRAGAIGYNDFRHSRMREEHHGTGHPPGRDAGVVITMLPNSASVTDVIGGPAGVLARARSGAIVLDMSTVAPEVTDAMADAWCELAGATKARLAS